MTTRRTKPEAEAGFACSHTRSALTCSARAKPTTSQLSSLLRASGAHAPPWFTAQPEKDGGPVAPSAAHALLYSVLAEPHAAYACSSPALHSGGGERGGGGADGGVGGSVAVHGSIQAALLISSEGVAASHWLGATT